MNDHDTQVMWINSASQDFEAEPTSSSSLVNGCTALRFSPDDVNKIVKRCVERFDWKPNVIGKSLIATTVPNPHLNWCECGSCKPAYWMYDGHGIALCKVCDKCKSKKVRKYRSDIFTQYDADEQINPDW